MDTGQGPTTAPAASDSSRRNFFVAAIYGMGAVITAALALPASAYLLLGPKARKTEDWIDLGDVAKLSTGQPVEMVFRRNRTDGWKVISEKVTAWVVRTADNSVVAYGPQCTHLGCAHHWDDSKSQFVCPCHNSLFAIDGRVAAGPAPRPLDRYDLKVEGGKLLLGELRQQREHSV